MAFILYQNEYFEIIQDSELFYIQSFKQGFPLEKFNSLVLDSLPTVKITSFMTLKNVITHAPRGPEVFGTLRQRINLRIPEDKLKAYMTLYMHESDLSAENRVNLVKEIYDELKAAGIVFGINTQILTGQLKPGVEYIIAEGTPPENGKDAVIKLYETSELKPQVIDQGKVNHYELNLINHIKKGEWLGERIEPTPGFPGKTVTGKQIPPIPGRNLPLLFDRVSVQDHYENGVTTLYSKKNGAVYYKGDSIGVYDFLEIKGDVDFSTGNIDFDGYLSIKGTVEDNFSVEASNDVEILGEYGVGAADKISSHEGNIYIKGGITGRNKAVIRCKKNLYVKFLSDITVECKGSVYVGFYCMNSNVKAKQVIIESPKGKIIGGRVEADIQIVAAEIGNKAESRTVVKVNGFNRNELKMELDKGLQRLQELKQSLVKVRQRLQVYSGRANLPNDQIKTYEDLKNEYALIKELIKDLEYECKQLNEFLKTPGEGAIIAKTRMYPKVRLEIKNQFEELLNPEPLVTYYVKDNELRTM